MALSFRSPLRTAHPRIATPGPRLCTAPPKPALLREPLQLFQRRLAPRPAQETSEIDEHLPGHTLTLRTPSVLVHCDRTSLLLRFERILGLVLHVFQALLQSRSTRVEER